MKVPLPDGAGGTDPALSAAGGGWEERCWVRPRHQVREAQGKDALRPALLCRVGLPRD